VSLRLERAFRIHIPQAEYAAGQYLLTILPDSGTKQTCVSLRQRGSPASLAAGAWKSALRSYNIWSCCGPRDAGISGSGNRQQFVGACEWSRSRAPLTTGDRL
jgi:hypothetical protein